MKSTYVASNRWQNVNATRKTCSVSSRFEKRLLNTVQRHREFWIVLLIPLIWYRSKFNLYHIKGYESSISELSHNESSGRKIIQA